jgi:hypothetical protein
MTVKYQVTDLNNPNTSYKLFHLGKLWWSFI